MPLKLCKLTLAFLATCGQIKAHTSDVIPAGDSNITEKYNIIYYILHKYMYNVLQKYNIQFSDKSGRVVVSKFYHTNS